MMDSTITGLLELAKIHSSQISEISTQVAKQGEQISEISSQVAKQGEQISEISSQVAKQGEQIAEVSNQIEALSEDVQFLRDVHYDFQVQLTRMDYRNERKFKRYQSDIDALRHDFLQLMKSLQAKSIL
jgi:predicted  nucleic acid-binding Zn-ribbon protein